MNKKVIIASILVLVSILILLFSYLDLRRYDSRMEHANTTESISNTEINNEIKESEYIVNEVNNVVENTVINNSVENSLNEIKDDDVNKDKSKNDNSINNKSSANETNNNSTKEKQVSNNEKNGSTPKPKNTKKTGKVIVIDPGHQKKGDNSKEPIGPGATEMKAKVTTGATGVSTKQLESELNLSVGMLLKTELEKRGYTVIMTRTSQNINISNSQRAKIANDADADAFIRIHADSYTSPSAVGMSALCQTSKNKYNGNLASASYNLSKLVLDNMQKETGAKSRGVTRTDTMSGINWATVPTTIIEMGFLSNPEEDKLLASKDYQQKIVTGMANGIDEFLK